MTVLRYLPRFRRAYRELAIFEERERWSRTEIESHQLERLNHLWAQAIQHVPYYRRLSAERSLPPRFASLGEFQASVPILPKQQVRTNRQDVLSDCAKPGEWHLTGGSTGAPTSVFRSHEAHQEMLRSRYRFHAAWGVDIFDRWAYLWGHTASFAPGWRGWVDRVRTPIEDRLRNRLRLSAYRLGRDALRGYLDQLVAFDPAAIYAYSTAGYLLAQEADAVGVRLPSLKMVNLTAEPAFPHIVETVERAFGAPAVIEYGSVECGFLAGEVPDRTTRVREDNIFIETTPRSDGRFDIIVTVLNDPSFPLIRYALGDVTDRPLEKPEIGFAILGSIEGRDNDLVFSQSGEPLHAFWFDDVFENTGRVRRYRVHQQADGAIGVLVELNDSDTALAIPPLERRLHQHVGYPVTIRVVDELPKTAAGKHRWVLSDLATPTKGAARHELQRAPEPVGV